MAIIKIEDSIRYVYVVLGIDENEHDQVLAVCDTFERAKQYCIDYLSPGCPMTKNFYDIWIEKHPVL